MEDLLYRYNRFREEKVRFNTLQEINPKEDEWLEKHLLHKLRDCREELIEMLEELKLELDSVKRVLGYEQEIIEGVNLK